jgi:PhnB protein
MKIPSHYHPVMPYIIVTNAKAFAGFAKAVFGATEQLIVPDETQKIIHGELKLNNAVIMFAESSETYHEKTAGLYTYVDDVERVYNAAISHGARSIIPATTREYGASAGFEDPFGNQWWIVEAEKEAIV